MFMPMLFRAFRLDPDLYERFKKVTSQGGLTVTGAFERFMKLSVENGALSFPASGKAGCEAQARILLSL